MPRILGVDIPNQKSTHISLTYIYGIGRVTAVAICKAANVEPLTRAMDLTDDEIVRLATLIESDYVVEGALRRQLQQNIARLKEIGCYRGIRHRRNLPVRGQKTRTNARTRKGPKRMVTKKK